MPSPAELAAKRRARLLARSQKGNGVKVVTAESLAEEQQGERANFNDLIHAFNIVITAYGFLINLYPIYDKIEPN